jgi:filamentous hemagglutinin family protein
MFKKIAVLATGMLISTHQYAEVITDGTLGRVVDLPGPNFQITDDLGQQMGENLFHSFSRFNINTSEAAIFSGPDGIKNILTRVTGGSESFIDGTLASDIQGANLYLLNPGGILFGKNAQLNISGSFHASTADYLRLGENGRFSVSQPGNSLLTVAEPSAFGFLDTNPGGGITIQGGLIEVLPKQQISLIGGDLLIDEGGMLVAPGGRINLASAASAGQVIPKENDLVMDSMNQQGTITISQIPSQSTENMELPPGFEPGDAFPELPPGFDPGDAFPEQPPGFEPGDAFPEQPPEFDNGDGIPEGPEDVGPLYIPNIEISGNGGQLFIRAGRFVLDNAWIFADTTGDQKGRIDIAVDGDVHVTNSAEISAHNFGNGQGTFMSVTADQLRLDGVHSEILVRELEEMSQYTPEKLEQEYRMSKPDADFLLKSVNEILNEPENISWNLVTETIGKEKIVTVYSRFFIPLFNTISIGNISQSEAAGGGQIHIQAPILTIDSGLIEAFTEGPGNAGNIRIDAEQVTLSRLGSINAATSLNSVGQGGNISIDATNRISLSDFSSITVGADFGTTGQAGNIDLNTSNLTLNRSQINTFSWGQGAAGSINITTDTALLTKQSSIYTDAENAGGGNITLQVRDSLELFDHARMMAEARGDQPEDQGGNITISNPARFTLDNSQLLANAYAGNGGRIDLSTAQFNVLGDSRIDVSSELGLNGELLLNSIALRDEFLVLPPQQILSLQQLQDRCAGFTRDEAGQLIITTRDTPPQSPLDLKTGTFLP